MRTHRPIRVGAVFPTTEIGTDPDDVVAYMHGVERLGFDHVVLYDHVLGVSPSHHTGWSGRYSAKDAFHEPFVLMGFIAAVTTTIEMATGILVLPQRQTAVVAKQATEVDLLSRGRLRLGVGAGWNEPEFRALGADFSSRGARLEEQVIVLRELWAQLAVDHAGRWEQIAGLGLNPRPLRRIPIWMGGGGSNSVLDRITRIADGWFTGVGFTPNADGRAKVERVRRGLHEHGHGDDFGIESLIYEGAGEADCLARLAAYIDLGFTHVNFVTMGVGHDAVNGHLDALARFHSLIHAKVIL